MIVTRCVLPAKPTASAGILLRSSFVFAWFHVARERYALQLEVQEQAKQVSLSIDDANVW